MYEVCKEFSPNDFFCIAVFNLRSDPVVLEPSNASGGPELAEAILHSLVHNADILVDEPFDASRAICNCYSFEASQVRRDI